MPQLIVNRASELTNKLRSISIEIDGKEVGILKDGESKKFDIAPGIHSVIAKIDWCTSNEISFEVLKENDIVRINLNGTSPLLGLYYITFAKNKYLKLTQVE